MSESDSSEQSDPGITSELRSVMNNCVATLGRTRPQAETTEILEGLNVLVNALVRETTRQRLLGDHFEAATAVLEAATQFVVASERRNASLEEELNTDLDNVQSSIKAAQAFLQAVAHETHAMADANRARVSSVAFQSSYRAFLRSATCRILPSTLPTARSHRPPQRDTFPLCNCVVSHGTSARILLKLQLRTRFPASVCVSFLAEDARSAAIP